MAEERPTAISSGTPGKAKVFVYSGLVSLVAAVLVLSLIAGRAAWIDATTQFKVMDRLVSGDGRVLFVVEEDTFSEMSRGVHCTIVDKESGSRVKSRAYIGGFVMQTEHRFELVESSDHDVIALVERGRPDCIVAMIARRDGLIWPKYSAPSNENPYDEVLDLLQEQHGVGYRLGDLRDK
jgi:hypothetical protein